MRELRSPVVLPALGLVAVLLPGGCSSAGYGPFCRGAAGDLEMGGAGEAGAEFKTAINLIIHDISHSTTLSSSG